MQALCAYVQQKLLGHLEDDDMLHLDPSVGDILRANCSLVSNNGHDLKAPFPNQVVFVSSLPKP
jgi:hypothetical protein